MLLMIESRGLPVGVGVATPTIGFPLRSGFKLTIVEVGMARAADPGGPAEGDEALPSRNLRLVTTQASRRPVLAGEGVAGRGVVERSGLLPSPRGVTRLAFGFRPTRRPMRVFMALETPHAGKPEFRLLRIGRAPVALRAGDGGVRTGQWHAGLYVVRGGVHRRPPTGNRMAALTAVLVGRRGELTPVAVFVAIATGSRVGMVVGYDTHPDMALHARDLCV
jgi:hypothetical protein